MPQLERRFYLNPYTRFDVFKSRVVVMHYMGDEIKRRRLRNPSNLQIMRSFVPELGPLATGVPLPIPTMPLPEEVELGEENRRGRNLRGIEQRLAKIERDMERIKKRRM
jgi:hypothetical protein